MGVVNVFGTAVFLTKEEENDLRYLSSISMHSIPDVRRCWAVMKDKGVSNVYDAVRTVMFYADMDNVRLWDRYDSFHPYIKSPLLDT